MPWLETESLSFTARHEAADTVCAQRILDDLEDLRLRLEERFEAAPEDVAVVVHTTFGSLDLAHPYLPVTRLLASPAGRRYLAGFATRGEIHVLNDSRIERRAAGEDSREALRRTAERLYVQLVVAANNPQLPPPWNPRRFRRYLRWAWLIEGAAQYFAGHASLFRPAVIARMRERRAPAFPPAPRDAVILGGTVFDLLEAQAGPRACEMIVSRLRRDGPPANIEFAFDAPFAEVERRWRAWLDETIARR